MNSEETQSTSKTVQVPAPTAWPLVAAFGLTFVFAGLLTHVLVSILGAVTLIGGLVGWFCQVLPHEAHEAAPVEVVELVPERPTSKVRHLQVGEAGHRARLPLQTYPYMAGVRGGLVGGAVMAVFAILYGVIAHHSIWYPINLLAAAGSSTISSMNYDQLRQFSVAGLVLGTIIHVAGSALVGLLYGVALPMFPRRPILLGGVMAPLFWTGMLHAEMGVINPALQARIDWLWFLVCQFAFGLVAGFVVNRHEPIATFQHLPFVMRAGLEGPGISEEKGDPGP